MPCKLDIDDQVKADLLLYSDDAASYREIDGFLLALEEDPYPATRLPLDEKNEVFYLRLSCGFFISWQVLPDRSGKPSRQLSLKRNDSLIVRILAIARSSPAR